MTCEVELIIYPEPCTVLVTQGEFDETIATYEPTNVLIIQQGVTDEVLAVVL